MEVSLITSEFAKNFLNSYHPLPSDGCLKGAVEILGGFENGWPVFVAVFVAPRSRWKYYDVTLELSRLAWSPVATHSATTFLRKCVRVLKRRYSGLIVTYALPGTDGIVYQRAGFKRDGESSGRPWSKRGQNERATPDTVGTGKRLPRFFAELAARQPNNSL